jgi:hypothetical protein
VRDWLIRIAKELDFVVLWKISNTQDHAKHQFRNVQLDCVRNVARQTFDFNLTCNLLENSSLLFHPGRLADQFDRDIDLELLVHGNTLDVDMQQRPFDRLVLPVHDHGLGALAVNGQVENRVMAGF